MFYLVTLTATMICKLRKLEVVKFNITYVFQARFSFYSLQGFFAKSILQIYCLHLFIFLLLNFQSELIIMVLFEQRGLII